MSFPRTFALLLGGLASGTFITATCARQIEDWPFAKLMKKADLVVIANMVSETDAGQRVTDKPSKDYLVGVLTTFEVKAVLKGKNKGKNLTLFHYRYDWKKVEAKGGIGNGPMLVSFHNEKMNIVARGELIPLKKPAYLLFLRQRADGRYECVSGQVDPSLSVRQLIEPLMPPQEE
jgi:hypothetical protein